MNQQKHARLRKLFDVWSIQNIVVIFILKALQFFRNLGAKAETAGWRKVSGIFVRNEYSKFMLASFRLKYTDTPAGSLRECKNILVEKLQKFIREQPPLYWAVRIGKLSFNRKRINVFDIMEAETDSSGNIVRVIPHFDKTCPPVGFLPMQITFIINHIITVYNTMRYEPAETRMSQVEHALKIWISANSGYDLKVRLRLTYLVDRIMSSVFVFFETKPGCSDGRAPIRFHIPDLRKIRHPGWGMLCIAARFSEDFSEVDLWWQCSHVTADGAPIQELMNKLKKEWGTAGVVQYPALPGSVSIPDTVYCGDKIFRAKIYIDFSILHDLRKHFNENFQEQMHGKATLAGIFLWGISVHPFLEEKKFLVPVDLGMRDGERELGLLVIRPGKFREKEKNPMQAFLNFQREFNRKLNDIREGHGESDEFLQLCTMLHPIFYHAAKFLAPDSLNEILGTIGFSMIRDSEMFVGPFTEFQANGFLSLGNVSIPTVNGKHAGSLCISGDKKRIRFHLEAISQFMANPEKFFLDTGKKG